jgi:hypothetical protein
MYMRTAHLKRRKIRQSTKAGVPFLLGHRLLLSHLYEQKNSAAFRRSPGVRRIMLKVGPYLM